MTQKETDPKIDDNIFETIKEEHRQAALKFIEFLKPNKLLISGGKITYKGKRMGSLGVFDNVFQLTIQTQFDEHFNKLVSKESEQIRDLVKNKAVIWDAGVV